MKAAKRVFIFSVLIQVLIWIVFSIINLTGSNPYFILAIFMGANGICFLLSALLFDKGTFFKVVIYVFLIVNLMLTLTDQMGFYDYLVLVLNVVSIVSLITYSVFKKKQTA